MVQLTYQARQLSARFSSDSLEHLSPLSNDSRGPCETKFVHQKIVTNMSIFSREKQKNKIKTQLRDAVDHIGDLKSFICQFDGADSILRKSSVDIE